MLKYSYKIQQNNKLKQIPFKELYLAQDLSYITGVTEYDDSEVLSDIVILENSYEKVEVKVEWIEAIRQGIASITIPYNILNYNENGINFSYIVYNDNYVYIQEDNSGKFILLPYYNKYNNGKVEYITNYRINVTQDDKIDIPVTLWVENGYIDYKGKHYNVEKNDNEGFVVNGDNNGYFNDVNVIFFDKKDYIKVRKFKIDRPNEIIHDIEDITGSEYDFYFTYKNEIYHLNKINDNGVERVGVKINVTHLSNDKKMIDESIWCDAYTINNDTISPDRFPLSGDTIEGKELFDFHNIPLFIKIQNTTIPIHERIINSNNLHKLIVYMKSDTQPLNVGDSFFISYPSDIEYDLEIHIDENGRRYVIYDNDKIYIEDGICDEITINNEQFPISYNNGRQDGKIAYANVYGSIISGIIKDNCTNFQRLYNIPQGKEFLEVTYPIKKIDGFIRNNIRYPLNEYGNKDTITINDRRKVNMIVTDKIGASSLVCTPFINKGEYSEKEYNNISKSLMEIIIQNKDSMVVSYDSRIFGDKKITPSLPYTVQSFRTHINTAYDYYNLSDRLKMSVYNSFITLQLPISNESGGEPLQDNIVETNFFESERRNITTNVVDMEKEVYYPVYPVTDDNGVVKLNNSGQPLYNMVNELKFNLHFRTRDENSWKIIEDDGSAMSNQSNWYVTDYEPYKHLLNKDGDKIQASSDLLGLLYYTNNDVYYQKNKFTKSFLRLSFYDSINPQTQSLLATSTIFFNGSENYKKYINNTNILHDKTIYDNVDKDINTISKNINVKGESYQVIDGDIVYEWDYNKRLDSSFTVRNKYDSDYSSEGYYIYMFREYSTALHPNKIYMKVEFNHAGVGKTLPFFLPKSKDGHILQLNNEKDVEELKSGVSLEDAHRMSYIPLNAVYDSINRKYSYYFDKSWVNPKDIEKNEDKIIFNLFEMKIKNED